MRIPPPDQWVFPNTRGPDRNLNRLKMLIWLYFWLLIFEGALRKWVLPQFSAPLLLVRDPVALAAFWYGIKANRIRRNELSAILVIAFVLILLGAAQIVNGVGNLVGFVFGLHAYLLHLPMIVVVANSFDADDLVAFGRKVLLLAAPMAVLMVLQFQAPASSWLNSGTVDRSLLLVMARGGPGQALAALGHVRPAGTFSFNTGVSEFLTLLGGFLALAVVRRRYSRLLIAVAAVAMMASVAVSGSRTTLFLVGILLILFPFALTGSKRQVWNFLVLAPVLALALYGAAQLPIFSEGVQTMQVRWDTAAQSESGDAFELTDLRVLDPIGDAFSELQDAPSLGKGIGMGSNAAAVSVSGQVDFLMGEGEWQRILLEFGPVFGLVFMAGRVWLACALIFKAHSAAQRGNPLAWFLLPLCVPLLLTGVMEQTTSLGFVVLGAGLCLAVANATRVAAPLPARVAPPAYATQGN